MGRVVDLNLDMVRNAFGLYGTLLSPEIISTAGRGGRARPRPGGARQHGEPRSCGFTTTTTSRSTEVTFVGSPLTNSGAEAVGATSVDSSPRPTISAPARSAVPVMVEVARSPMMLPAGEYQATVTPRARPGQAIDVRVEVVAPAADPARLMVTAATPFLTDYLEGVRVGVNEAVAASLPAGGPRDSLYSPLTEFVGRAGKSIRPALCIAAARAHGAATERVMPSAVALGALAQRLPRPRRRRGRQHRPGAGSPPCMPSTGFPSPSTWATVWPPSPCSP